MVRRLVKLAILVCLIFSSSLFDVVSSMALASNPFWYNRYWKYILISISNLLKAQEYCDSNNALKKTIYIVNSKILYTI